MGQLRVKPLLSITEWIPIKVNAFFCPVLHWSSPSGIFPTSILIPTQDGKAQARVALGSTKYLPPLSPNPHQKSKVHYDHQDVLGDPTRPNFKVSSVLPSWFVTKKKMHPPQKKAQQIWVTAGKHVLSKGKTLQLFLILTHLVWSNRCVSSKKKILKHAHQ